MAVYDILPETNLTDNDIRDTLNDSGGYATNVDSTYFTASNINWWSKYKPMVWNLNFINLWDKASTDKYYYQGSDGKCGLSYNIYTDVGTFKTALEGNKTGWSYNAPTGGSSTPFRWGDFRRYYRYAINPIGALPSDYIATRVAGQGDSVQIDIEVAVPTGTSYNLGISDFSANSIAFKDMYLGVYMIGNSKKRFVTSTNKIGTNGVMSIKVPLDNGEGGTYTVYTFLSSVYQDGVTAKAGTFVSIGGTAMNGGGQTIKVQPAGSLYVITASASAIANTKEYYYYVTIKNNGSSAVTFKNVKLQVYHDTGSGMSPEGYGLVLAESISIPAGSTHEFYNDEAKLHSTFFTLSDLNNGLYGVQVSSDVPELTSAMGYFEQAAPMVLKLKV